MMCATCAILAKRNEELQAEVGYLKEALYSKHWEAPAELRLTASQERLLGALLKHERTCAPWFLFEASRTRISYADNLHGNLVSVMVSHIRKKLRPWQLHIETVYARGYRMPPATRSRLLNWNTSHAAAAA
jgi:DNA-binding response OmpR family regulator